MPDKISVEVIPEVPFINKGDDVGDIITTTASETGFVFVENDILCVASKAISLAEGRIVALRDITPSDLALEVHKRIPRKDPRAIQVIIDATGAPDGSRLDVSNNYIAGWLPNGYRLTSAGVDKMGSEHVILLPRDPDASARNIARKILDVFGTQVGVIITDSDGRVEKAGSTQLAIGLYGVPALRRSESTDEATGKTKIAEETLCDLVAASAALIMGQRGTNKPAVVVRGVEYEFDETSRIRNALSRPE